MDQEIVLNSTEANRLYSFLTERHGVSISIRSVQTGIGSALIVKDMSNNHEVRITDYHSW